MNKLLFLAPLLAVLSTGPAWAAPELITNGGFETNTLNASTQFSANTLAGWTNGTTTGTTGLGYNFLILPGTADTTGFTTILGARNRLIGPDGSVLNGNLGLNGMPDNSPVGGNAMLSSTNPATSSAVSQVVSGLTVGQSYDLSFYWAAAQFAGTLGTTSEAWQVTFGATTQSTPTATQLVGSFTPWTKQSMTFTATAATQTLSFLATSPPNGLAAAALLDGVSLTSAPEPASWALFAVGMLGLLAARRRLTARVGTAFTAAGWAVPPR